jgi:hypothetical protein
MAMRIGKLVILDGREGRVRRFEPNPELGENHYRVGVAFCDQGQVVGYIGRISILNDPEDEEQANA